MLKALEGYSPPAAELFRILAKIPTRAVFQRAQIKEKGHGHFIATPKDCLRGS